MSVRAAAAGDVEAIASLSGELGYPAPVDVVRRRLDAIIRAKGGHTLIVAVADDSVIGWIHVAVVHSLENDPFAEIRGLIVTESQRGGGAGTRLVRAAEEWARSQHLPRMRVRTNVTRTRTHSFYQRLGFTMSKEQKVFDKPLP